MAERFLFDAQDAWARVPPEFAHREVADAALDAAGNVYLFTRKTDAVLVFDAQGTFLRAWGTGVFSNPHAVRVIGDSVYCVDSGDHTVRRFTLGGELLQTLGVPGQASDTGWDGRYNGTVCRGAEPFNACTSIAASPDGDLYVSDGYGNCRIHRFAPDGTLRHSWGEPGTGEGEFHLPHGILVARSERVLVADRENDRIQVFDLRGRYLEQWAAQRPCAMAEDKDGYVYVAELGWRPQDRPFRRAPVARELPGRVSILAPSGALAQRIESASPDPCARGAFVAPHGICIDGSGNFYLAEVGWTFAGKHGRVPANCHSIQKFTRRRASAC